MKRAEPEIIESLRVLIAERNTLRAIVAEKEPPKPDTPIAQVLQNALDNKRGWREEARQVLGAYKMVSCEMCGTLFPSGGKRRKYCGNC